MKRYQRLLAFWTFATFCMAPLLIVPMITDNLILAVITNIGLVFAIIRVTETYLDLLTYVRSLEAETHHVLVH